MHSSKFLFVTGALLLVGCTAASPNGGTSGSSSSAIAMTSSSAVPCTMEAKLCPDGSYVGRSGPNCEFSVCPVVTSSANTSPRSVSDGTISFTYPTDFGLAITKEQILVNAYIPPCDEGFNDCLYYNGKGYAGTNFETAGLAITNRTDLASESDCLSKEPDGYANITPLIRDNGEYKTSAFSPLGDAAAGHYAQDRLYRLSLGSSCYEFRTRIGLTRFANFPAGTIREFTVADETALQTRLDAMLNGIKLKSGQSVVFPEVPGGVSSSK